MKSMLFYLSVNKRKEGTAVFLGLLWIVGIKVAKGAAPL